MPVHRSTNPPSSVHRRRRLRLLVCAGGVLGLLLFALLAVVLRENSDGAAVPVVQHHADGPPWRHGQSNARFVLTLYADLECPFCKDYYPSLKTWIDQQADVSLQWQHLPLPAHEPAASALARVAECAGEIGGNRAFFDAVGWLYQHTSSSGQGLPDGVRDPGLTPDIEQCLASEQPDAVIRAQAAEAMSSGVTATPSVRLHDQQTGRAFVLQGPVAGDSLLSAMDMLASDAVLQNADGP